MMNKFRTYIPYVVIVILLLMYMSKCARSENEVAKLNDTWRYKEMMYTNNRTTLLQEIDKQGREITTQENLIMTAEQEKEMLLIENKRLKSVKSEVKIITTTIIKEVYVPFETTIYDTISGDSAQPFNKKDDWFMLSGMVLKKGIRIDSLEFKNKLSITIGEKSNGLFKKNTPVTEVTNDNPYTSVSEMYNVHIEKGPKKFYQTTAFKIGIGVAGGIFLTTRLP